MDLLGQYGDDSDTETNNNNNNSNDSQSQQIKITSVAIEAAPQVDDYEISKPSHYVDFTKGIVDYNPKIGELYKPLIGPKPKALKQRLQWDIGMTKNNTNGFVEEIGFDNTVFDSNYHLFEAKKYGYKPSAVNDTNNPLAMYTGNVDKLKHDLTTTKEEKAKEKESKEEEVVGKGQGSGEWRIKRKLAQDASDPETFKGPWAPREDPIVQTELTEEQKEYIKLQQAKKAKRVDEPEIVEEFSELHIPELYDYQGRSYVSPPSGMKPLQMDQCKNYIPKKLIHTWTGHTKALSRIKMFPGTGHLLLSASQDTTVKIWEVGGKYRCLRTFTGHSHGVRDINFSPDGKRFMSCSYDKYIKLWDTETGQCISRHTSGKVPYCVTIYPMNENEVLVGQGNKVIQQWDLRSNEETQRYEEHLGAVNTVTFIDHNRRFVSTSDDRKLLIWEYGIPVVIKHLAEPDMHSMPFVAVHPSGKFFVGQSQDNQILVFTAEDKYKLHRRKRFLGHLSAGYAAEVGFSPDGQFIMSGDAQGRVFFWDWKTSKCFKKLKAHDQVTIGAAWNPIETSKVATASWDGTIKYWD